MKEILQDIGLFAISFVVSFATCMALDSLKRKRRHRKESGR